MKSLLMSLALVGLFAVPSQAEDARGGGHIANATLADFGLSTLKPITDSQGEAIRGKGFSFVWGKSVTFLGSPSSYLHSNFGISFSAGLGGVAFGGSAVYAK